MGINAALHYLLQLIDALLHTTYGGHRPQGVCVKVTEAVLPADLKQGHHSALLWTNKTTTPNLPIVPKRLANN
jgi:hypothetical protein